MKPTANIADVDAARVCRAQVADLLRQGWTAKSLSDCSDLSPETVSNILHGRRLSWRTCGVVDDVHRALSGALAHFRRIGNYRNGTRVQTQRRHAALEQSERVRVGYRWGATVEQLAEQYELPPERVRLIVGDITYRTRRIPAAVPGQDARAAS